MEPVLNVPRERWLDWVPRQLGSANVKFKNLRLRHQVCQLNVIILDAK